MRKFLLLAGLVALSAGRPDTYREKEDFQYSRSSTDEGKKSGYYGAQRGNMGGNYEKAHNMDSLAQNQMSGLITQVHGELGEGANTRTGSVYGAASTRGTYGQGHFDLSNLEGKNFQEGATYGDSSHSASSRNSAYSKSSGFNRNSGYSSHNSEYGGEESSAHNTKFGRQGATRHSQQLSDSLDANSDNYYNRNTGHIGQSSEYHSESRDSGRREYSHSSNLEHTNDNAYDSDRRRRIINYAPVRVVIRPGTKTNVPFLAQTVEDIDKSNHKFNQNSLHNSESGFTDTDDTTNKQDTNRKSKHYESSFSYRKEWEKHGSQPVGIPLSVPVANPLTNEDIETDHSQQRTSNSRLIDNSGLQSLYTVDGQRLYNNRLSNSQTASRSQSQTRDEYDYENRHRSSSSASNSNMFGLTDTHQNTQSTYGDRAQISDHTSTEPKRYESSYSYQKSWERQGDPYVIKPIPNQIYDGQKTQRLTDTSSTLGHGYHQYGSQQYKHSQQRYTSNSNGDDCEDEHVRVARSYRSEPNQDYIGQETQTAWGNSEDMGQQSQSRWTDIEDNNQQFRDRLTNFNEQSHSNTEDLGQQTQNNWSNFEGLNQHSHDNSAKLEDLGQQTQTNWGNLEYLGQQTQNSWDKLDRLNKKPVEHSANLEDFGQQSQNSWTKLEDYNQNKPVKLDDLGQQSQNNWDQMQEQQNSNTWDRDYQSQKLQKNLGKLENSNQQTQNNWDTLEQIAQQNKNNSGKLEDLGQQTQNSWGQMELLGLNEHSDKRKFISNNNSESNYHHTSNIWSMIDSMGDTALTNTDKQEEKDKNIYNINKFPIFSGQSQVINIEENNKQMPQTENPKAHIISATGEQKFNHANGMDTQLSREHSINANVKPVWENTDEGETNKSNENINQQSNQKQNSYMNQENHNSWSENHQSENKQSHYYNMEDKMLNSGFVYHKEIDEVRSQSSSEEANKNKQQNSQDSMGVIKIDDNAKKPFNEGHKNVGRGDIESDDISDNIDITNEKTTSNPSIYISGKQSRHFKTLEEIESLSLSKDINKNSDTNTEKNADHQLDSMSASNQNDRGKIYQNANSTNLFTTSEHGVQNIQNIGNQNNKTTQETNKNHDDNVQQVEDLGQQFESFDQQNEGQWDLFEGQLEDLGQQQQQPSWTDSRKLFHNPHNIEEINKFYQPKQNSDKIINKQMKEDVVIEKQSQKLESLPQSTDKDENKSTNLVEKQLTTETPPEIVTEKPGFWKSVGNKFSNAKDKVASWFS